MSGGPSLALFISAPASSRPARSKPRSGLRGREKDSVSVGPWIHFHFGQHHRLHVVVIIIIITVIIVVVVVIILKIFILPRVYSSPIYARQSRVRNQRLAVHRGRKIFSWPTKFPSPQQRTAGTAAALSRRRKSCTRTFPRSSSSLRATGRRSEPGAITPSRG